MLRLSLALVTFAIFFPPSSLGVRIHDRDINAPLLDSYDYVVVGCGISGLVVTNRLSEDTSVSVLCIEAGIADHYEPIIQDPVYVGADVGGVYDWDLSTTPQTQLDGAPRPMPQGKVLGGGSILNAMCWNRGGQDDYNTWADLGNPGWDWEGILPYFRKSETYTPVYSADIAREYSINYNPAVHGTSGPVQVSYPRYFYPQSANLFAALNYLGVPTEFDPNDGSSAGAAFVPTDIDPNNQTRSDARRSYFDPIVNRENFHVITGQHVTRVLIEGIGANYAVSNPTPGGNEFGNGMNGETSNSGFGFGPQGSTPALDNTTSTRFVRRQDPRASSLRITGVEYAANASDTRRTITATREVIIAAGALHSAQLLQLSGIGPSSLLDTYDIPVALDLPGVGNNLQDHCLVGTFYPYNNDSYPSPSELTTNSTYNEEAEAEYNSQKTGPWTAGSPNALAFNPLPLISSMSDSILSGASSQESTEYLIDGLDSTIVAGYAVQKQSLVRRLAETTIAAYEIINNNAGSLTVAVMHPFSRGQCYIRSPDPFEPPNIDPRWLSNPVDRQVLVEALLFNRQILATPAMIPLQAAQFVPPVDADEDAINQVISNGIRTEFHPSGTCAMLPLEQGGVVDSHLRVWGTQNLRVVDAGIMPMIPAAHLQAVVYAIAEKAADIIKLDNYGVLPSTTSSSALTSSEVRSMSSIFSTTSTAATYTSATSSAGTSSLSSAASGTTTSSLSSTASGTTTVSSSNAILSTTISYSSGVVPTSSATYLSSNGSPSTLISFSSITSISASEESSSSGTLLTFPSPSSSALVYLPSSSATITGSSSSSVPSLGRSGTRTESTPSFQSSSSSSSGVVSTSGEIETTPYSLPTSYSMPSSYPLPSSYTLPVSVSYELPLTYTIPSTVSYELPSSYTVPTSLSDNFSPSNTLSLPSETDIVSVGSSSLAESLTVVVSAVPTSLLQALSSISIPTRTATALSPTTSGILITVTPASSVLSPSELSSYVSEALTSGGLPSSAASALVPVIIGSAATSISIPTTLPSSAAAAATTSAIQRHRYDQATIAAFIEWLLQLLDLDQNPPRSG